MTTRPTDRLLPASSRASAAARWLPTTAVLMAASLTTGCYVYAEPATVRTTATVQADAYAAPNYVTVSSPPPPIQQVAARPAQPRSNTVWVDGYWDWQGQWVWRAGEWRQPQNGYEWEAPVCVAVEGGGYQYHEGYWRGRNQNPPPIYRTPGTIQVSADPTPVVQRVPIRPGQETTGTVYVQPSRPSAPSDTVVVRPGRVSGSGTVTVRPGTQPSGNGTVVVRPGGSGTTTVRPSNPNTTVTVRPSNPGAGTTTTVRPSNPNTTVTVRPSNPGAGTTTTVRPTNPNVTVRPSSPGTGTTTTVRPSVRPSDPGTGTTTTVRPPNTVTVRPSNTVTVRPSNPRAGTTTTVRATCNATARVVPAGGVLTLQGTGLAGVVSVTIGGRSTSIMSNNGSQIRARVGAMPGGGSVIANIGNERLSCGNVNVVGGAPR